MFLVEHTLFYPVEVVMQVLRLPCALVPCNLRGGDFEVLEVAFVITAAVCLTRSSGRFYFMLNL